MDVRKFLDRVSDLTDLELAMLLSLIAQQHCLVTTEDDLLDDLAAELALIASEIFGLSYAVISQEDQTSVDRFGEAILDNNLDNALTEHGENDNTGMGYSRLANVSIRADSHSEQHDLDRRMVVNVLIAKDFNLANQDVQIAALELVERRRIFSRTTVHPVPKKFLFIPLISSSSSCIRLNNHLNDRLFISHYHDPQDGYANLEAIESQHFHEHDSVHSLDNPMATIPDYGRHINYSIIEKLREMGDKASMTTEMRRYIQDIVVFMRIERGVDGGVTPAATTMFVALSKYLAPLHSINFVTPSLIHLAARKVYAHRIKIAIPGQERSMQYGSDLLHVQQTLDGLSPDQIIENVLIAVPCPL